MRGFAIVLQTYFDLIMKELSVINNGLAGSKEVEVKAAAI